MADEEKPSARRGVYVRVRLKKIKEEIDQCRADLDRLRAGETFDHAPRAYYAERIIELTKERGTLRAEHGKAA